MDIEVAREALVKELALARRLGERKGTIPVYGYARLDADFGEVGITSTDGDAALETGCAATVHAAGKVLVPVRTLHEMAKAATAETVRISSASGDRLDVRIGSFKSKLGVLPVQEFPTVAEFPTALIDLRAGWLARALEKTRFVVESATTTTGQFMHGAQLSVGEGKAKLVSTDGRRLAVAETDLVADGHRVVVLPRKSMDDLSALLAAAEDQTVGFAVDEQRAFFKLGVRQFTTRVMATTYPAYQRIIPVKPTHSAEVSRDLWLAALRRVMLVAAVEARKVRLVMADGAVTLFMESAIGSSEETVAATLKGSWETAFDAEFLADFLAAADVAMVTCEHSGGRAGAKFTASGGGLDYTYVLMPMTDPVAAPTAEAVATA